MNKFFSAVVIAAAMAATPALAVTYVAFPSFNGVNGNGGFTYGFTDGTTLTAFDTSTVNGGCALGAGSTCLYSSTHGVLPQASVGGSYPTVSVPADMVLVHPGDSSALNVYGAFVAPTAGTYTYKIDLKSVGIDTTDGTLYTAFTSVGGLVVPGATGALPTYQSTGTLTGSTTLAAGQLFGVYVNRNTSYGGDSTGLNITISDVPEPAMWGMMLAGFALVGVAARRRTSVVTA